MLYFYISVFQLLSLCSELLCSTLLAKSCVKPFQVRKAKTHSCTTFLLLFYLCVESLGLIWCSECLKCFGVLFGFGECYCYRRTVARPVNLAQASQSRLGEISRDSPKTFARKVAQATSSAFWASEHLAQARGISPKRDPACDPASFFGALAQAKGARLSEHVSLERGAEREDALLVCFVALGWLIIV